LKWSLGAQRHRREEVVKHRPQTRFEERRRASRFARDEDVERAAIWFNPGDDIVVPVCDESLGGISLLVDDDERFPLGGEVGIAYASSFFQATVIHIQRRRDGKFKVGFQVWESG
jgi:hypothetical protein